LDLGIFGFSYFLYDVQNPGHYKAIRVNLDAIKWYVKSICKVGKITRYAFFLPDGSNPGSTIRHNPFND